jgi:hypothetical protein
MLGGDLRQDWGFAAQTGCGTLVALTRFSNELHHATTSNST